MSPEGTIANERAERLRYLHQSLVSLLLREGSFVSERTSIFLIFNSIFFAGFLLLRTHAIQAPWNVLANSLISVVGIVFAILQSLVISQTKNAAKFWRATILLIEQDAD